MSVRSKATLVSTALKLCGSAAADLQTEAELWLDLVLEQAAGSYRFPELNRSHTATIGAGTATVPYPTDYGFLIVNGSLGGACGYFLDSNNARTLIYERTTAEARNAVDGGSEDASRPMHLADDFQNSRWLLYPQSNEAGTLVIEYQCKPVAVGSSSVVWYDSDLELIDQVKFLAERYLRAGSLSFDVQIKEASRLLSLRSPRRGKLFTNMAPGADLDPRWFRR